MGSMCEAPHEIRDFFLRDFLVFFHAIFRGGGGLETSAGDLGRVDGSRNTVARRSGIAGVVAVVP